MMLGIHVAKMSKVLEKVKRNGEVGKKTRPSMFAAVAEESRTLKLSAVQIYTHGPRNFRANKLEYDKVKEFTQDKISVIVHSTYGTGASNVGIWRVTEDNKNSVGPRNAVRHLADQLAACEKLGGYGLVVHLPQKSAKSVADTLRVDRVQDVLKKYGVPLLLEMVPSKDHPDDKSFLTPDQINELIEELEFMDDKMWGVCVDTAHLWGGGVEVSSAEDMQAWIDAIGDPSMIKLFHLNGSEKKTWNSGRDVHITPFSPADDMYHQFVANPKKSGVYPIVKFCMENRLPVICEINRGSEDEARECLKIVDKLAHA